MKRPREDSSSAESDVDETISVRKQEIFTRSVKPSFVRCASPTTTTQVMARKKRRGIIEKRRRDRINSSLLELRRLVPTAFEKQGSAKLEKAEILQMTVDHLKMLQAAAGKGNLEGPALALDFLSLGFRDCVTEVSRFLSSMEGLDSSSPLHSRLLSHLTSCSSQRDAAALAAASHQHPHPYLFPPYPWAAALRPLPYGLSGPADAKGGELSFSSHADSTSSSPSSSSSLALPCTPTPLPTLSLSSSFPFSIRGGFPVLSSFTCTAAPTAFPISSSSSSSQSSLSSSKPYWPWGTEVGAF